MKKIEKYTIGMGDRFTHQGVAQLSAVIQAQEAGIDVYPVWNKSHREHQIVGTEPISLTNEAAAAVKELNWDKPYHVDADHIRMDTVSSFLEGSDFFTLDVSDAVGEPASSEEFEAWLHTMRPLIHQSNSGDTDSSGSAISDDFLQKTASKYLRAAVQAGELYRHIADQKDPDTFITELSIDETSEAQSPEELWLILSMVAWQRIPIQTIAPKFTGRFNKGVDYIGNVDDFARDFEADLDVIHQAIRIFGLPETLKISVHTGSDKFSLYPVMNRIIKAKDCGLHLKTAGTTWLEELIGLSEAGGEALEMAKEIYTKSYGQIDDLISRYQNVISIDPAKLPVAEEIHSWDAQRFAQTLRHEPGNEHYNPDFRQLLHVGFKVAANMGERYQDALRKHKSTIAKGVSYNLLERHILPLYR